MLTEKQKRFINEYMVDLNGTQAAIRAGYSAKTARAIASETLKKPAVAARIASRKKRRNQRTLAQELKHLEAMWRVAMADPKDLFDQEGNLKPIDEWSDSARLCISDYKILETFAKAPGGRKKLVSRLIDLEVRPVKGKVRALIFLDKKLNPFRPQEPSAPTGTVQFKWYYTLAEARQYYPNNWLDVLERQTVQFDKFEEGLMRDKAKNGNLTPSDQRLLDLVLREKKEWAQARLQANSSNLGPLTRAGSDDAIPRKLISDR